MPKDGGLATFGYDANGNLSSDGSMPFVYDAENRLVSTSGARSAVLRYDPLGRLFQVTGGTATTRFLYDGDALAEEYVGGVLTHRYVHGTAEGVDDPLLWYDIASGGHRRPLFADDQGSVIAVADSAGNGFREDERDEAVIWRWVEEKSPWRER